MRQKSPKQVRIYSVENKKEMPDRSDKEFPSDGAARRKENRGKGEIKIAMTW